MSVFGGQCCPCSSGEKAAAFRRFASRTPSIRYYCWCFIVRDAGGQALADVYFEDESGRRSAASLITLDEARRIAATIAKLSALLRGDTFPSQEVQGGRQGKIYRGQYNCKNGEAVPRSLLRPPRSGYGECVAFPA